MRKVVRVLGLLVIVIVLAVVGVYFWASMAASRTLSATVETHSVDFPIPFPSDPAEVGTLGLEADAAAALALQRAVERGRHLVSARYACTECHGANFGGGVMVDAFPIGTLLGPNITTGDGSRTLDYTPGDWDRAVRHGVLPDGRPSIMPSEDFQLMSDQELSDVVVYIRSMPAVDNVVPAPTFGPLGKILLATGEMRPSATLIESHDSPHRLYPPETEVSAEFGSHLAGVCIGCHREDLSGGPISGGDPSWPPARNLTPDPTALGPWTYEQFAQAMREGTRPDGTRLLAPMTLIAPYAQSMTDVELEALWMYLRTVPPVVADAR